MILGIAGHAVGWPIPRGGSDSITRALVSYFSPRGDGALRGVPFDWSFEASFCTPGERMKKAASKERPDFRRNHFVPVPVARDLET